MLHRRRIVLGERPVKITAQGVSQTAHIFTRSIYAGASAPPDAWILHTCLPGSRSQAYPRYVGSNGSGRFLGIRKASHRCINILAMQNKILEEHASAYK